MAKAGLLFVGTHDGLVLFSNPGGVGRWLRVGQAFAGQEIRAVWPMAGHPSVVFASVAGAGLQHSDDGGQSWRQLDARDIWDVCGHQSAPHLLYLMTAAGQLYRSTDAGESWQQSGQVAPAAHGRQLVVAGPEQVYLSSTEGVLVSYDAGSDLHSYGTGLTGSVEGLACVPAQSEIVYAISIGRLFVCRGSALPWEQVSLTELDTRGILTLLAGHSPVVLTTLRTGELARSDDGGLSWQVGTTEQPLDGDVSTLAAASYHMDTAFAGTSGGQLLQSSDRGRSWQLLKQGLPPICSLAAARLA